MTTAITTIKPDDQRVTALDTIAKESQLVLKGENSPFKQMFTLAQGVQALQQALTPELMAPIMALQNKALGFRCDKNYPVDVVKDALIEATIRGLQPTGNEFNIIGGRCYITKEGFGRLLANIPGLRYMITPGIPKMSHQGAETPGNVTWTYNGEKHTEILVFPIKVIPGQGADAILGKYVRKARAWLYAQVTGMELGEGDVNDSMEPIRIEPQAELLDVEVTEKKATVPANDDRTILAERLAEDGYNIEDVEAWHSEKGWNIDYSICLRQYNDMLAMFKNKEN